MSKQMFVRRKTYTLKWPEGAELEGLEVRAKPTDMRSYLVLSALVDGDSLDTHEDDDGTVYDLKNADQQYAFIIRKFSQSLMDWNLTGEDQVSVPATEAGMWAQDREFVLIVIRAWLSALATVSRPLVQPSPAGEPLAGVSIPMETLSESQAS